MKKILVKCRGANTLPIDRLLEFQGGLKKIKKKNLEKLKNQILNVGFIAPIFVWEHEGDEYIIDGHQRLAALCSLRQDGVDIPMLPVDYIEADSEKDARKKLLSISSQYGDFDLDELGAWVDEIEDSEGLRFLEEEIDIDDDDFEIIDNHDGGSDSGGHTSRSGLSFWIYKHQVSESRKPVVEFVKKNFEQIKTIDDTLLVDKILEGINEILLAEKQQKSLR
jgi:hypothetical protein